ncbi:MAG: hypothetical protein M0R06_03290 [Sphaerochaeta sp.]|jgi:hypothetical protein|nr:hypothetical protein [Dehalococcoidia bacterium]MCK9598038.1 hypothetical protein [Sphaerochaeta sp.]
MTKYKWKDAYCNFKKIDVQVAAGCLEKLVKKNGSVTAEAVVLEARNKRSPLHECFEWDDKKAAHLHRINQACHLIKYIVIDEEDVPELSAFVHVEIEDEGQYVTLQTAKDDPVLREQILRKALSELLAWKKKYGELKEFMQVTKTIDKIKIKT